ncbi:MAG: YciI family protein [Bacteroidota bacterium]
MEFLITALDGTDEKALDRRMKARTAHLTNAKLLQEQGNFIAGGAILNEAGKMIGSTLYMQFENEVALQKWLKSDPYTRENVWQKIDIKPIKLVNFN